MQRSEKKENGEQRDEGEGREKDEGVEVYKKHEETSI
jgi:hypothetical protein